MRMIARYERDKELNVRNEPRDNARVVGKMRPGEQRDCFEVREGWARVDGGYAKADFLVIKLGDAPAAEKPVEKPVEQAPAAAPVIEQPAEQAEAPEPTFDADEASELRKMTNPQLYDLAEKSGIKVKKGAKKEELIAAILADE